MQQGGSEKSGQQEDRGRPSGPSHGTWNDYEISIFLLEWEVVEQEVGHKGRKTCKKVRAIQQRLYRRGLRKTWQECLQVMQSLLKIHFMLCQKRAGLEPLFTPYAMELYRILGHGPECSPLPGPVYDGRAGNPKLLMYFQPPIVWPTPMYQPRDSGFPGPSRVLKEIPQPMMYSRAP